MKFKWLNESKVKYTDSRFEILATPQADFFCGAADDSEEASGASLPESLSNAPFYYTEVEGDFVLRVKASHDFEEVFDAAALMVMKDLKCWAKFCWEFTDFNTHAVTCAVTNGVSDDACGCNIDGNTAWLQICRVGNNFAFHHSVDGENYYLTRCFYLPADPVIKVGMMAQAAIGEGGVRIYEDWSLEKRTVENIRAGK